MIFKKTIKGKKMWGVMKENMMGEPCCLNSNMEVAKKSLDSNFNVLVEIEVVKAYTRNPEFVEIVI